MAIPVIFSNSTAGMIEVYMLEELIAQGKIVAYRDESRWVRIGDDSGEDQEACHGHGTDDANGGKCEIMTIFRKYGKVSQEEKDMAIGVIYKNNKRGMIEEYLLDDLIREERIKAFRRSSGWVKVGRDPIREKWKGSHYNGMERRKHEMPPDYFF